MNIATAFDDLVEQLKYRQEQVDNLEAELSDEKTKVEALNALIKEVTGMKVGAIHVFPE
jgi:chromosome segregation ATPase